MNSAPQNNPFQTQIGNKSPTKLFMTLEDSEVATAKFMTKDIHILFSAAHVYINTSKNENKIASGFASNVEFILQNSAPNQSDENFFGKILSGRIKIENEWSQKVVLPSLIVGPVMLEIVFANQSYLDAKATGFECRFTGESNFFESMNC